MAISAISAAKTEVHATPRRGVRPSWHERQQMTTQTQPRLAACRYSVCDLQGAIKRRSWSSFNKK